MRKPKATNMGGKHKMKYQFTVQHITKDAKRKKTFGSV